MRRAKRGKQCSWVRQEAPRETRYLPKESRKKNTDARVDPVDSRFTKEEWWQETPRGEGKQGSAKRKVTGHAFSVRRRVCWGKSTPATRRKRTTSKIESEWRTSRTCGPSGAVRTSVLTNNPRNACATNIDGLTAAGGRQLSMLRSLFDTTPQTKCSNLDAPSRTRSNFFLKAR
ncbi:UNVERIFIED_CONTAM: hypothetical protein HHA_455060 [Hammondia hammondi]|eukprot:XP_008888810.1 hypothetical protein HHA_455060 [Hammondia hammondi]